MFGDWQSTYVMVDSVGEQDVPHPGEPDMQKYQLGLWRGHVAGRATSPGAPAAQQVPAILHDCHNHCGSTFTGPTLGLAVCNSSDPHQQWELVRNNTGAPTGARGLSALHRVGLFRDAGAGLCVGCNDGPQGGCGNDATTNVTGLGVGMRSCQVDFNGGAGSQRFNLSAGNEVIRWLLYKTTAFVLKTMDFILKK